ncbi:MAG: STAS domain-containing protein [Burkholderiales bacterium]|nr:STAS domain-containing protein [Burkholderiales bacterium]
MQLPARLSVDTAAAWPLPSVAREAGPLVVDASPLVDFDSAALAVLLQLRRQADAAGRGFALQGAAPKLVQLAQLYGVAALLGLPAADAQGAAA